MISPELHTDEESSSPEECVAARSGVEYESMVISGPGRIDATVVEEVCTALKDIERTQNVRILLACESGSRAWGFVSADSDYDVRFIYVRPRDWYLSVHEKRDVIERGVDERNFDLSGWDLKKALHLFCKSNPPLMEWLQSPTVYMEQFSAAQRLRDLIPRWHAPIAAFHHYLHMAQGNYREYLQGGEVRTKKYFYVLRPVLACKWIEEGLGVVPMEFKALVDRLLPAGPVRDEVDNLLAKKIAGNELISGPRIAVLNDFLDGEISRFAAVTSPHADKGRDVSELDRLFRETLEEAWKSHT